MKYQCDYCEGYETDEPTDGRDPFGMEIHFTKSVPKGEKSRLVVCPKCLINGFHGLFAGMATER